MTGNGQLVMEPTMSLINLSITAVCTRRLPTFEEMRALIVEWHQRARSRHELTMFNERELSDMGLTPMDAFNEISKPFWEP